MKQALSLTAADLQAASLGGAVLGGGGGGAMADGRALGEAALARGAVNLIGADALPQDAVLLTVSAVGAPAAAERFVSPEHYIRAAAYFSACFGCRPAGVITNECGGSAAINGWLQAAALGLPLVDAPCNGRAHPTGVMGSLGLHRDPAYRSRQVAVGGDPAHGRYLEIAVSGSLTQTAALMRQASIQAGGLVAVARNPVTAGYAARHAANGAIRQCIELGTAMLAAKKTAGGGAMPEAAAAFLGGAVVMDGRVASRTLAAKQGFDVGRVTADDGRRTLELTFWNEYMTLEANGARLATFPDLIATFAADGRPLPSAELTDGQRVKILRAAKTNLRLGAGMRDPELFKEAERAVGKEIIAYAFRETRLK